MQSLEWNVLNLIVICHARRTSQNKRDQFENTQKVNKTYVNVDFDIYNSH